MGYYFAQEAKATTAQALNRYDTSSCFIFWAPVTTCREARATRSLFVLARLRRNKQRSSDMPLGPWRKPILQYNVIST